MNAGHSHDAPTGSAGEAAASAVAPRGAPAAARATAAAAGLPEAGPGGEPAHPQALARAAFLRACELDVAVRKPGNVSHASPGHGMQAAMFLASARASAVPLFEPGAGVGARVEAAVEASWRAAGCNTNLGILLLCAPIARAAERLPVGIRPQALRSALETELAALDEEDARATFRAIARAQPGGLGRAEAQDVHAPPTTGLREAMALAAHRDLIARQYANGYAELFERALPCLPSVFVPITTTGAGAAVSLAVQQVYLALLASLPDSHIVRKHGEAVAQNVMAAAQGFAVRARHGERLDADAGFVEWDESLKARGVNPGTTADLTVATLMIAGLVRRCAEASRGGGTDRDTQGPTLAVRPVS